MGGGAGPTLVNGGNCVCKPGSFAVMLSLYLIEYSVSSEKRRPGASAGSAPF